MAPVLQSLSKKGTEIDLIVQSMSGACRGNSGYVRSRSVESLGRIKSHLEYDIWRSQVLAYYGYGSFFSELSNVLIVVG